MDWVKKIIEIKNQLRSGEFHQLVGEIEDAQMVLGTQGEMFLSVVAKLREIRNDHKVAYSLIEGDAEAIFSYGRSINYLSGE